MIKKYCIYQEGGVKSKVVCEFKAQHCQLIPVTTVILSQKSKCKR